MHVCISSVRYITSPPVLKDQEHLFAGLQTQENLWSGQGVFTEQA